MSRDGYHLVGTAYNEKRLLFAIALQYQDHFDCVYVCVLYDRIVRPRNMLHGQERAYVDDIAICHNVLMSHCVIQLHVPPPGGATV